MYKHRPPLSISELPPAGGCWLLDSAGCHNQRRQGDSQSWTPAPDNITLVTLHINTALYAGCILEEAWQCRGWVCPSSVHNTAPTGTVALVAPAGSVSAVATGAGPSPQSGGGSSRGQRARSLSAADPGTVKNRYIDAMLTCKWEIFRSKSRIVNTLDW